MYGQRKLRRNDVVMERINRGFAFFGRVWRRIDDDHVEVIDCGRHVTVYREDYLILKNDYKGSYRWQHHPGNEYGNPVVFNFMPSLRKLKSIASKYNAHFGGMGRYGSQWTKEDRTEALRNHDFYEKPDDYDIDENGESFYTGPVVEYTPPSFYSEINHE